MQYMALIYSGDSIEAFDRLSEDEQKLIQYFDGQLEARGYRIREMLRLITLSDAFFAVHPMATVASVSR